ncbi:MAG: helix-turn-helix domain-containing protein [Spirochaetota bacterium]|jgi:transcriptional regulator with XRE-family HTH domain
MDYVRYCLASNLRLRRAILQMSQEELAQRADLSPGFIANIETGRNFPSSKAILKISAALKIEPWKLFLDPQKQDLFFTRDEIFQWFEDSRKRLFGYPQNPEEEQKGENRPEDSTSPED